MEYLTSSMSLQHKLKQMKNYWTIEEAIIQITENAKFFIAVDGRCLLKESKAHFMQLNQKFLMVEIKDITFLKQHGLNLHFMLNKGDDQIGLTISTVDFKKSGLYFNMRDAAIDINIIMDEYEKRRKVYQHNLNQTNKGITKLMKASAGIIDSYPEAFV